MSVSSGAFIYSGSIFYIDLFNPKSYAGEPTTNLLPTPSLNGYPTYGNYWYTYNTNQYGSGTYFSIGTVSSVSSNIVTMTAAHSLRTYDVMQPQTTGGGVTAGTNYLIKKLSSTTFCLYPYDSSQDGSKGYINISTGNHKVYDSMMLDQKVSINASSFPTMWWGAPHLPNSGLVKEIIPGGFDVDEAKKTDCIRLHYIRDDGVLDGMSYGPDASVTIGSPVTTTFWTRAVTNNVVGATVSFQHYNYGGVSGADGFYYSPSLGPVGVWKKNSFTFTPTRNTLISYWFFGTGQSKYDIANIQIEQKGRSTQFVPGTRSDTQALLDLTRNSTVTASSLTYASDGSFSFNYDAPNYITVPLSTALNKTEGTMNFWLYPTRYSGGNGYFVNREDAGANAVDWLWIGPYSDTFYFRLGNGSDCCSNDLSFSNVSTVIPLNNWVNMCFTWKSNGTSAIYKNGALLTSRSIGNVPNTNPAANGRIGLGHANGPSYFDGKISEVQIYNRQLTGSEVLKNYYRSKSRYGL